MRVFLAFCAGFVGFLIAWFAVWTGIASFTMWHWTWPPDWDPMGRFLAISAGLFLASAVGIGTAQIAAK